MSSSNFKTSLLQIAVGGLLLSTAAISHAAVVKVANADNHEIPLADGTTVTFESNGDIVIQCALNETTEACDALSTGGSSDPAAPSAALSRADTDTSVTAGESIQLKWTSTAATVCHARAEGPATTTWGGAKSTSSTGQTIQLATAGTYRFYLQCFNEAGGSLEDVEEVAVGPAVGPPPAACNVTDPLIAPAGLNKITKSWVAAWSAPNGKYVATYPNSIGYPVPIGAEKNGYTVVPFVPAANQSVKIFFDGAQPSGTIGYNPARTALGMMITISPCEGDLRAPNSFSSDPFVKPACRIFANTGSLYFSTKVGTAQCTLEAGKQYYMNIAAIDTSDGLQPGENSCGSSFSGCDVQATHKAQ